MNIRPYREQDYREVLGIYAQSKLDELRFERTQFALLPLEEDRVRHLGLFESTIYVYEEDEILGYGAIYDTEIRALFVKPDGRGRGIGSSLLKFLLTRLSGTVSLNVVKSNTPALHLYSKHGFSTVREFECDYNGQQVVAVEMVRLN